MCCCLSFHRFNCIAIVLWSKNAPLTSTFSVLLLFDIFQVYNLSFAGVLKKKNTSSSVSWNFFTLSSWILFLVSYRRYQAYNLIRQTLKRNVVFFICDVTVGTSEETQNIRHHNWIYLEIQNSFVTPIEKCENRMKIR